MTGWVRPKAHFTVERVVGFEQLRSGVLSWLDSLRVLESCCRYKFHVNADDTIFCTCFALYILDLFKEAATFSDDRRKGWISSIQGFQNEQYGWFEPKPYHHEDRERNRFQLTCFCLSALRILGAEPRFPLTFIEQWRTPDDVRKYLCERGCHQGRPGSGNKAMFLAIFLTCEYERTKEDCLLDKMGAWFEFHNRTQNRSGFWGSDLRSHSLYGLQNGLHQLAIYFYWGREIPRLNRIIDVVLMSQDRDGFFAPTPGGEACHDYDAIHILALARRVTDYKKDQIGVCLSKAFDAILTVCNGDGGFCQSKANLAGLAGFFRYISTYCSGGSPYLWYYRSRASLAAVLKDGNPAPTGWTRETRASNQSNLWDTWFRCLALAEIAQTIDEVKVRGFRDVNFQETPGLGWFRR